MPTRTNRRHYDSGPERGGTTSLALTMVFFWQTKADPVLMVTEASTTRTQTQVRRFWLLNIDTENGQAPHYPDPVQPGSITVESEQSN